MSTLPTVQALSTTGVQFSSFDMRVTYPLNGVTCRPAFRVTYTTWFYSASSSGNSLRHASTQLYNEALGHPVQCSSYGSADLETDYSFPSSEFQVSDVALLAPTIETIPAYSSTQTDATLSARIWPNDYATRYHFEYGLTAPAYGNNVPALPGGSITSNLRNYELVSHTITGLQPNTTYHFRLVASNANGTSIGPDHTFTTPLWRIQPTPNPGGATDSYLSGVGCEPASTNMCIAVGTSTINRPTVLAERWNGTSWALSSPVVPTGSTASSLSAVACPATTSCIAVGSYTTPTGTFALAERWNGTSWTILPAQNAAGAAESVLNGITCTSTTSCAAVGYERVGTARRPMVQRWNGTSWSMETVPMPSTASRADLESVGCRGTSFCMAVGHYSEPGAQQWRSMSAVWNGSNWSLATVPDPAASWKDELFDVTCTGTTVLCTAAGIQITDGVGWRTLIERWNGTAWATQPSPNTDPPKSALFNGVHCSNADSNPCNAVGYWTEALRGHTFAARWNGSTWSRDPTPNPTGSERSWLEDVSCRLTTCIAVGGNEDASGVQTTLAEIRPNN